LKACVQYLKPVIDDHNFFLTSSEIKDEEEAGEGTVYFPLSCFDFLFW